MPRCADLACGQSTGAHSPNERNRGATYFFFPRFEAPSTIAVFLCALALLTLMNRPVMALRPIPTVFLEAGFFEVDFLAMT
ncbi:MAG: hypothetical protein IPM46_13465 [Flavobacteriales bacterium]|nr:hypothetical protein [Flavobacteriales bacterium]